MATQGIALSAIAVLTQRRGIWYVGLLCALIGLGFLSYGFIPIPPAHSESGHSEEQPKANGAREASTEAAPHK